MFSSRYNEVLCYLMVYLFLLTGEFKVLKWKLQLAYTASLHIHSFITLFNSQYWCLYCLIFLHWCNSLVHNIIIKWLPITALIISMIWIHFSQVQSNLLKYPRSLQNFLSYLAGFNSCPSKYYIITIQIQLLFSWIQVTEYQLRRNICSMVEFQAAPCAAWPKSMQYTHLEISLLFLADFCLSFERYPTDLVI